MKVCVLASGSKGNSTLVQTENSNTLIDIGMSNLYIEKKLISLGIDPNNIDNILITHPHIDHIAGLNVFIKKHNPTICLTQKMYEELKQTVNFNNYIILEGDLFLNDLNVKYFKTSHDAIDSVGYILSNNNKELVYVTDTGYINNKYFDLLTNKDMYIFESNHDVEMLMDNPHYPYQTKQRILSDKGHLSNKDSSYYLSKFIGDKTKYIFLAHLSEQNNNKDLAIKTLQDKIGNNIDIKVAEQDKITELVEI